MSWKFIPCKYGQQLFSLLFALVTFTFSFAQNPIVKENALPGNPIFEWGVPDFKDKSIAGFATKMSVNSGETIHFKIDVRQGAQYRIKIYRIGYYAGNGARLVAFLGLFKGTVQPAPITNTITGLVDCGNWSESAHWDVPASAVSGLYIAKLIRTGGGSNHIVFIVRNDNYASDLLLQFPDTRWQAYNGYGDNSLYNGKTEFPNGHAVKVSYNRPFFIYNAGFHGDDRGDDWYMNCEYPMIRWLERNGYNITYTNGSDVASSPAQLLIHKVFISLGHDEYWSKEQRENVEAARNAGVHLAFFSGNEVYWKTRWENSVDGTNTPYRTLVCYKEGTLGDGTLGESVCGAKCDVSSDIWTGLWRMGGDYDAGKPENALTGQISWDETQGAIQVPAVYKKLRFWRNTTIPNLTAGKTATLAPNTLGYEWDWEQYPDNYPPGRITMSSTTLNGRTHKLSLYRHSSGALVFGAGTIQWSWGLDGEHYNGTSEISKDMQQATVNLFADMDVQPGTLQANLTRAAKSTDVTAPISKIISPVSDTSVSGSIVTVTGYATDGGGGVVAGVEISLDGGATWYSANTSAMDGNVTWSYSWLTSASGIFNVKSRGFDDSGNRENPGTGINIIIKGKPYLQVQYPMFYLILTPIAGVLIFFGLRRTKRVILVYCILLTMIFILTIPIFFTYSKYTSANFRDILITLFLALAIASLIQKGLIHRIVASLLLLLVLLKGPLFGIYFPQVFDISGKIEVKKFDFENFSLTLEKTHQNTVNDFYHWKGKKYLLGKILYYDLRISDSSINADKCIQTLYISRVKGYEKDNTTLERIVSYDTCENKIVAIEKTNR
jgi:hypothetical protein